MTQPPPPPWAPPSDWPAPALRPGRPATGRWLLVLAAAVLVLGVLGVLALALLPWLGAPSEVGAAPDEEAVADAAVLAAEVGASLDRFWDAALHSHGSGAPYLAVGDRVTDGNDGVACDGASVVPDEDLVANAFAQLCREGPVVAYDPAAFGGSDLALRVVLAHEWGHVAQALDPAFDELADDPTTSVAELELQADCYAGAWAATAMDEREQGLAVLELRALGDPASVPADDPDGHGTADERAAAFRTGLADGVTGCMPGRFDAR